MPVSPVPLAKLCLVYTRSDLHRAGKDIARRRLGFWAAGLLVALATYVGVPQFFSWKHEISSSGGHYFLQRVVIPVPVFTQNDPRWTFELLGPTYETLGQAGCAVTSAAMVLAAYGVDTDPDRLNQYLTTNGGYTENGWVYWEKAAAIAPGGQVEKAYEDLPSYDLIDNNIRSGNPVIVRIKLSNGTTHFVVVVGKEGWNYLIQDPARSPTYGVYPLKDLTSRIEALRFFRVVPPHDTIEVPIAAVPSPIVPVLSTAVAPPAPAAPVQP
jgi:hypothetical protein